MNSVVRAGLVLIALEEPTATAEAAAAHPALAKHITFPHFLHVAAVRAG